MKVGIHIDTTGWHLKTVLHTDNSTQLQMLTLSSVCTSATIYNCYSVFVCIVTSHYIWPTLCYETYWRHTGTDEQVDYCTSLPDDWCCNVLLVLRCTPSATHSHTALFWPTMHSALHNTELCNFQQWVDPKGWDWQRFGIASSIYWLILFRMRVTVNEIKHLYSENNTHTHKISVGDKQCW